MWLHDSLFYPYPLVVSPQCLSHWSSSETWWRHQMTFSALLAFCEANSPVTGDFPSQRPVTRSFDVFFDLRLNKRLGKPPSRWWLWAHQNTQLLILCGCLWETIMLTIKMIMLIMKSLDYMAPSRASLIMLATENGQKAPRKQQFPYHTCNFRYNLWTCRNKHFLILLWVFMTNDIVYSEHEMSTAKSVCYMAPPALVSKCQSRKMVKNIRPTHPHYHSAAHDI